MEFRRLPFRSSEKRFFVGSVDSFLGVIWRHVPTVCGSLLEAQSVHAQAPILPVGTLVPLPPLWHFNGAGILALRNQQPGQASLLPLVGRQFIGAPRLRYPSPKMIRGRLT